MPHPVLAVPGAALRVVGTVVRVPFRLLGLGMSRRAWVLWYAGYFAALAVKAAARKIKERRDAFDGLGSIVSFSSCMIAAARAAESEREDRFVYDPLASVLAGRRALQRYGIRPRSALLIPRALPTAAAAPPGWSRRAGADPAAAPAISAAPLPSLSFARAGGSAAVAAAAALAAFVPPERPVPRLVMRTRFFDDAVLASVWGPGVVPPDALGPTVATVDALSDAGHGPCRQVVMLGAGMDTRPWRLNLPPGVCWFEVDRADVLAAKVKTLARAGVQLRGRDQINQLSALMPHTFNLAVERWHSAACDLQVVGWTAQLELQGLDLLQPTCWVAEGLLYYLDAPSVAKMLREAAAASAPGSVLVTNLLTESGLKALHRRAAERRAAAALAAGGRSGSGAVAPAAAPAGAAAGGIAAAADAQQASSAGPRLPPQKKKKQGHQGEQQQQQQLKPQQQQQNGAAAAAPPGPVNPTSLTDHFQWGCPDNVERYLADAGWTVVQRQGWRGAATAYGWVPQPSPHVAAGEPPVPPEHEVQFLVAVRTF